MRKPLETIKKLMKKYGRKPFILAGAGVLLLLIGSLAPPSGGAEKKPGKEINMEEVRRKKEDELEKFLVKIDGISEADVMIAYRDSGSKSYTKNSRNSSAASGSAADLQVVMKRSGGEETPVEERTNMPEIKGVTVIARGDPDISVKTERAVSAALGVEIHKIEVIINEEK